MKSSRRWLGLLAVLSVSALTGGTAKGAAMDIRAVFRPDPSNPMQNKFINETPVTGHCESQPAFCKERELFSLLTPIGFQSIAPIQAGADQRRGAMFRVPGDWRRLSVRHSDTHETAEVEIRIVSIGGRYILPDTAENLVGEGEPTSVQGWHTRLWGDWTWEPPVPCQYTGGMYTGPSTRTFFWLTSASNVCAATANYPIPALTYDQMQIGYELRTPNPLKMSSGQYTGNLIYTVGPGMDFDMGDIMQPDDSTLALDFLLDVQHTLKVDLPPGGNKVALEPAGGWQQWIDGGRKPTRIFRDQTFYISASSRFKVMMQCPDTAGVEQCILRGEDKFAYVRTSLTLPAGLTNSSGGPVNRYVLRDNIWSEPFQPSQYVDRKVGVLHFEVPGSSIENLLKPGISGTLSTNITIIWDSEI